MNDNMPWYPPSHISGNNLTETVLLTKTKRVVDIIMVNNAIGISCPQNSAKRLVSGFVFYHVKFTSSLSFDIVNSSNISGVGVLIVAPRGVLGKRQASWRGECWRIAVSFLWKATPGFLKRSNKTAYTSCGWSIHIFTAPVTYSYLPYSYHISETGSSGRKEHCFHESIHRDIELLLT